MSTDLQIIQVKAVALAVSDLKRTSRFYSETLGRQPAEEASIEKSTARGRGFHFRSGDRLR